MHITRARLVFFAFLKDALFCRRISHQDVELLPALGKVDPLLDGVRVADVDKGEVLQHQPDVGDAGRTRLTQRRPTTSGDVMPNNMTSLNHEDVSMIIKVFGRREKISQKWGQKCVLPFYQKNWTLLF